MPGYRSIEGNEKAQSLAKDASTVKFVHSFMKFHSTEPRQIIKLMVKEPSMSLKKKYPESQQAINETHARRIKGNIFTRWGSSRMNPFSHYA